MQPAEKGELRRTLLDARTARSEAELLAARAALRGFVVARCAAQSWRVVAAYVPLRGEPGSIELLDELVDAGVRVLIPFLLSDRDLDWTAWGSDEQLGVDAITQADAVLAPATAVSRRGVRLGRGGASYDRALTRVGPDATVAALVFDNEVLEELPADPWDVPVGWAVTPSGWTRLTP
ncbi:MAG TPA: 5-formyltetrahydrofolate cyclo-ligase [Jatrophihabitantaceae bacterium]|nr:5-formyltetrahydrofolate cyclo-ligase [Jatrophihabitantaceae bacterium]